MASFDPNKSHLREVLLPFVNMKKSAAEAYRLLLETYGAECIGESTCREWFKRFKSGNFDVEDKELSGRPKNFKDEELEALLGEDPCQTQEELAASLGVTQQAISLRLKALGFIQKVGNWVPYELKPRDVERPFPISEMLLERHKKKSFLHRIITGDEKWIYYDNPKRKKTYTKTGEPAKSTPKRNVHVDKVMLCIWWDQKGVLYNELLPRGQTINGPLYKTQLIR